MQIYVTSDSSDNVFSVDVGAETDLAVLKVLCESECGIASDEMVLVHEGRPLTGDEKQMAQFGLKDGDMVMVSKRVRMRQPPAQPGQAGSSSRSFSLDDDPEVVRQMFLNNPDQLVMLRQANPRLASALDAGDAAAFARILKEQLRVRQEEERRRIRMLTADPFDPETQALIAEEIRQKNVDANMEQALEFNPESFGVVVMLYIDCTVNGHHVKAFVDSGAQTTLMSAECAERCGIRRLIDSRWGGIAKGVGTQRITGRVHMAQIQIAGCFLASSFSILEEQPMDMLLGLDMLRRHQCIIDLKRNVLVIGTTGKETRFLAESELPACARLSGSGSDADKELAKALAESATEAAKVSAVLPTDKFNEDQVNKVVATTSCSRDEAMNALRAAEGNPDVAMLSILARGLAAPGPSPKK